MARLATVAANDTTHSSHKESHDDYAGVIVACGKWRVITCKGNIQWIIQKGILRRDGRAWQGMSYCWHQKSPAS
ncbi:hypothetical protein PsAD13_04968 [Pseudovibrio sp. Ad13]|nr:hypothetical protein PsAD13_04968 [Pseudovibrio sp. Ad13]